MTSIEFSTFLHGISKDPLPVLDANLSLTDYIPIDLSIDNFELHQLDVSSSDDLHYFIQNIVQRSNASVAYGGYNEIRNIYQRSSHFNKLDIETERNIHLGLDLWLPSQAPIFAPLEGFVHSFRNNTNYGDYGPTIILEHHIKDVIFYTLYGHLSMESITNLTKGQKFLKGEQLATLGDASVNGDYPPHLHFQIIKDLGKWEGDYPGVCNKKDLEFYLENCPDPNLLLKLSEV